MLAGAGTGGADFPSEGQYTVREHMFGTHFDSANGLAARRASSSRLAQFGALTRAKAWRWLLLLRSFVLLEDDLERGHPLIVRHCDPNRRPISRSGHASPFARIQATDRHGWPSVATEAGYCTGSVRARGLRRASAVSPVAQRQSSL